MKPYRWLVAMLVLAVVGVVGAQWLAQHDPSRLGQVIVRSGGWDYSTTVPRALLLLVLAWLALGFLWSMLRLPFRAWSRYRKRHGLDSGSTMASPLAPRFLSTVGAAFGERTSQSPSALVRGLLKARKLGDKAAEENIRKLIDIAVSAEEGLRNRKVADTDERVQRAIDSGHPFHGLSDRDTSLFLREATQDELYHVRRGIEYYLETSEPSPNVRAKLNRILKDAANPDAIPEMGRESYRPKARKPARAVVAF